MDRQAICKRVSGTIHVGSYLRKWYGTGHHNDLTIIGGCDKTNAPDNYELTHKIGYVGRISEDKRTDIYQNAMDFLPDYKLEIVSDLPHDKIPEFWADKDFAFCNGQLSMLEAMSYGVPCISLASNPMVFDMLNSIKCKVVMNELDIRDTVNSLSINTLYIILSKEAYRYSQQNTWQYVADQYLQLWRII
jgi:glycosyltransferase involved in cell wall biosynthesis